MAQIPLLKWFPIFLNCQTNMAWQQSISTSQQKIMRRNLIPFLNQADVFSRNWLRERLNSRTYEVSKPICVWPHTVNQVATGINQDASTVHCIFIGHPLLKILQCADAELHRLANIFPAIDHTNAPNLLPRFLWQSQDRVTSADPVKSKKLDLKYVFVPQCFWAPVSIHVPGVGVFGVCWAYEKKGECQCDYQNFLNNYPSIYMSTTLGRHNKYLWHERCRILKSIRGSVCAGGCPSKKVCSHGRDANNIFNIQTNKIIERFLRLRQMGFTLSKAGKHIILIISGALSQKQLQEGLTALVRVRQGLLDFNTKLGNQWHFLPRKHPVFRRYPSG